MLTAKIDLKQTCAYRIFRFFLWQLYPMRPTAKEPEDLFVCTHMTSSLSPGKMHVNSFVRVAVLAECKCHVDIVNSLTPKSCMIIPFQIGSVE